MLPLRDALATLLQRVKPLPPEPATLANASGRFLAEPILSPVPLPRFSNSAMDGYAVSADAAACGRLPLQGESRAGDPPKTLAPGTAMRIFTGAPLPQGADAIVIQENVVVEESTAIFTGVIRAGQHVRAEGSDLAEGAVAIPAGVEIGPGELGLLAGLDRTRCLASARPKVAVVCTGDELREPGETPRPGSRVNTNAYILAQQIERAGAEPWVLPVARDQREEITARIQEASAADFVLSVGGVSVGDHDHAIDAYAAVGAELIFHKVAIKPGKPLAFALLGDTPFVGLPGNPNSARVTFEVAVRPCLRHLMGARDPFATLLPVTLAAGHRHALGRLEFARARIEGHGDLRATLLTRQGSGSLPALADVNGLVILDPERAEFEAGERLLALPLAPSFFQPEMPYDRLTP